MTVFQHQTNEEADSTAPLVSIAMPIYNEESFLRAALQSLVDQDYPNLEIIIVDNASTDATPDICREFARKHKNIAYHCNDSNLGIVENARRSQQLCRGRYWQCASGHDLWSENHVSECVRVLESDSSVVLAYGTPHWIGVDGLSLSRHSGWYDTRGMDPGARVFTVFWGSMNPILGVIRMSAYNETRGWVDVVGSDLVLLAELSLVGSVAHVTTASIYRRDHRAKEDYRARMARYRRADFRFGKGLIGAKPSILRLPWELTRSVMRSRHSLIMRLGLLTTLFPMFGMRYLVKRKH